MSGLNYPSVAHPGCYPGENGPAFERAASVGSHSQSCKGFQGRLSSWFHLNERFRKVKLQAAGYLHVDMFTLFA